MINSRVPDALQRAPLLRRAGIVPAHAGPGAASQRYVLQCVRDTTVVSVSK
jgi:hypothetical protein